MLVLPFGVMCSLGLAGLALSFAAILNTKSSVRSYDRRAKTRQAQLEAEFASAKEAVSELTAEVHHIRECGPAPPPMPRRGFNISTRSQALRMHRRGDSPARIADVLQVPLQEVELLLKVHQIVLENLIVAPKPDAPLGRANSA
ncbi:MAG TPA: hypothetical protein VKT49_10560 [Bryobacteraceae bacterium]|nr:hypothetical protein [Bryobacteraceae bacterium]